MSNRNYIALTDDIRAAVAETEGGPIVSVQQVRNGRRVVDIRFVIGDGLPEVCRGRVSALDFEVPRWGASRSSEIRKVRPKIARAYGGLDAADVSEIRRLYTGSRDCPTYEQLARRFDVSKEAIRLVIGNVIHHDPNYVIPPVRCGARREPRAHEEIPPPARTPSIEEQIESMIDRNADGHWIWTGPTLPRGQPRFKARGGGSHAVYPYRFMWQHHFGEVPTSDIWIVPTCGNRLCVNPEHLGKFTAVEGMRRFRDANRIPPTPDEMAA